MNECCAILIIFRVVEQSKANDLGTSEKPALDRISPQTYLFTVNPIALSHHTQSQRSQTYHHDHTITANHHQQHHNHCVTLSTISLRSVSSNLQHRAVIVHFVVPLTDNIVSLYRTTVIYGDACWVVSEWERRRWLSSGFLTDKSGDSQITHNQNIL